MDLTPPTVGLIAMRIAREFGAPDDFVESLELAVDRGGERGASIVAVLDRGDLVTHIPQVDGPSWNTVPLLHLHRGQQPTEDDWAVANAIVERLERYR
jgi:hypothetical protein